MSPSAFNAIAEDDEVKKSRELLVADLQERAREASLRGDWNRVEQIIMEGGKIARDNEWLQKSLGASGLCYAETGQLASFLYSDKMKEG